MGKSSFKLFLLFTFTFSFIFAAEEITKETISYQGKETRNYRKSMNFEVKLDKEDLKDYLHFEVINQDGGKKNQIVTVSSTDEKCLDDRLHLGMQANGIINVFFPSETFRKNVYVCVQCIKDCNYNFTIKDESNCQLKVGDQYSYYIGHNKLRQMAFEFSTENTFGDTYFWVKGEKKKDVRVSGTKTFREYYSIDYLKIYSGKTEEIVKVEIDSEKGDYITIGSMKVVDGKAETTLIPNNPELIGIVDTDEKELCIPLFEERRYKAKINGMVYTKKAKYFVKNQNQIKYNGEITHGMINNYIEIRSGDQYCVEPIKHTDDKEMPTVFSIQLLSNSDYFEEFNYSPLVFAPQFPGLIYGNILLKGELAYYYGREPTYGASEINYNMKAIYGFPEMSLSEKCTTFPDCEGTEETPIDRSNRMSIYSFYLNKDNSDFNPISAHQPFMIVKCRESEYIMESDDDVACIFETSIYTNKDEIHILPGHSYSQFLLANEEDLYSIDLVYEDNIKKIYLDLMVFSGDADFEIDFPQKITYTKHYLSNKIFYIIDLSKLESKDKPKKLTFKIIARKKTFYLIQYQYVHKNENPDTDNEIESGVNYIESIYLGNEDESGQLQKTISLQSFKKAPYLANFYSQNCQFEVLRQKTDGNTEQITFHEKYGQTIIGEQDEDYGKANYKFSLLLKEDSSSYDNKLCMIYVSGLELFSTAEGLERAISISEGVPQFYFFTEEYPAIKYTYHVSDPNNPVVIQFNMLDKGAFNVKYNYGKLKEQKQETKTIYKNDLIIINAKDLVGSCEEDEICNVYVSIELIDKNRARRLETSIYQINGAPIYLENYVLKQDMIIDTNQKYYYMDIGTDNSGYISLDFKRGNGFLYGKIVDKNMNIDKNPTKKDWRGRFDFPKTKEESDLDYDPYIKSLIVKETALSNCGKGCYLLLTVEVQGHSNSKTDSETEEEKDEKELSLHRFSLVPYLGREQKMPSVNIPLNEFVTCVTGDKVEEVWSYYEVTLPVNGEYIYFDWQTDDSSLFINIGHDKPLATDYHFYYKYDREDTIFELKKTDIISKMQEKGMEIPEGNNIQYLCLTLGVFSERKTENSLSAFSFKVFMPMLSLDFSVDDTSLDIIEVRSNQKVHCDTSSYSGHFLCFFAVIFEGCETNSSFIAYPRGEDDKVSITFVGDKVDAEQIDMHNTSYIMEKLQELDQNSETLEKKRFWYEERINKKECLLFLIHSEVDTKVELISSTFSLKDGQLYVPNPTSTNIFALVPESKLILDFEGSRDYLINIVSVIGDGFLHWENAEEENNKFYMNGIEDRLTLTSGELDNVKCSHLIAQACTINLGDFDNTGFIFYFTYKARVPEINMDQIKAGRSVEINYRNVLFPLNFYTYLNDKDLSISFNFYNYHLKENQLLVYEKNLHKIWGKVITEKEADEARFRLKRPEFSSDDVVGSFDGAFGSLFLTSKDMQKYNISNEDHPTLFFSVELGEGIEYNFNGITLELSVLREQSGPEDLSFTPESVYLNGKLELKANEVPYYAYKLKIDPKKPYMCIEFSSNNDDIECAVRDNENFSKEMITELIDFENNDYNGKHVMTFKLPERMLNQTALYFIIYYNGTGQEVDPCLTNYVFKYMFGNSKDSFFVFPHEQDEVEYTILESTHDKTSYEIKFHPILNYQVNYIVKAIYKESIFSDEVKDTIAISESHGRYWNFDNPPIDENNITTLNLSDIVKEVAYIKVLARVNNEADKLYVLYHPIIFGEDDIGKPDEKELIATDEVQQIDFCTKNRRFIAHANNVSKIQSYRIQFDYDNKILNYYHVETISKSEKNQIIYFSPTSEDGKKDRLQLGQSISGEVTEIYVKKEQFEKPEEVDYFFIIVECREEKSCSYDLQITSYKMPQISTSTFVHDYYVSENNQEMKFKIKNTLDLNSVKDHVLTIYAIGGKNVNISIDNLEEKPEQYDFKIGTAITIDVPAVTDFEITVQAEIGDFITVGSKITGDDGLCDSSLLIPNGHQITGYLKTKTLEKECYALPEVEGDKEYYITGIFYNRIAEINFKNKNKKDIRDSYAIVNNGLYTYIYNSKNSDRKYICIGYPTKSADYLADGIPYSIQLTEHTVNNGFSNIFLPQVKGVIYPRIIPTGTIVNFHAQQFNSQNPDVYNMQTNIGYPKLFMYKCTNYPVCDVTMENIDSLENIVEVEEIGRVSNWVNNNQGVNTSPIDPEQYIMFVLCYNMANLETHYCQFQTSIYEKGDDIYLLESEPFSKLIQEGETDNYIIDCSYESVAKKVHLDTLVLSGDVDFTIQNDLNKEVYPSVHKYYLANKMFYSISLPTGDNKPNLRISIKAKYDSYYSLEYKVIREQEDETINNIYEGINNLVPIPTSVGKDTKTVKIYNRALLTNSKYLINFNSLNCKFEIAKINLLAGEKEEVIEPIGHFAQTVIDEPSQMTELGHYFKVSVKEHDPSKYTNNMCMLYINALQITEDSLSLAQKNILIADGVTQKVLFNEKVKKVKYSYPNADINKNFTINFKILKPAEFNLTITYNHQMTETKTYSKSEILFIDTSMFNKYCNDNELCHISLEIEVTKFYNDVYTLCEVSFRQINNIPHYISKGIVLNDFIFTNSHLYLFTNIGYDDQGYVSFNFARGSGLIFGKIVQINPPKDEENAIWRSFSFADKTSESIDFDFYSRKLKFNNQRTHICSEGCYLLLSIIPSITTENIDFVKYYQFTLTVSLTPTGSLAQTSPIIELSPEEYVIGSLDQVEKIESGDMYEYYLVNIPFETENIQIDWQSDAAILLVNVGEKRPNLEHYDFIFNESRGDTLFEISRDEIISHLNNNEGDSIVHSPLTFGVYTEEIDSVSYTTYAFKVHFQHKLDIIKVNSDQKSICEPTKVEDDANSHYRCLFMVIYNEMDYVNDLMIYARSQNPAANVHMYGNFTDNIIYDSYDEESLQEQIPDEKSEYNTEKDNLDFIFLSSHKSTETKKHFYVSVVSDKADLIEFVTSMKSAEVTISPNPATMQVFAIKKEKESESLSFMTTKGLLIKFTSLYGSAKLIVSTEPDKEYNLRGRDDRLTIALPSSPQDTPTIKIINLNANSEQITEEDERPGFAFYLEYYLRHDSVNFDEVNLGKTTEIVYKSAEFPISFYAKVDDLAHCINIFFNLHDLELAGSGLSNSETEEFSIKGSLIEQKTVYTIKRSNSELRPSIMNYPTSGIYDPALKAGIIHFSYKTLQDFGGSLKQPSLYVTIENSKNIDYTSLRMEFTAYQENVEIPVTEKSYQHGKIYDKKINNCYKLKVDQTTSEGYMRIQFSSNNINIKYTISDTINDKNNGTFAEFDTKTNTGKSFITFKKPPLIGYIYLNVFLDEKSNDDDLKYNHYSFKYINSERKEDFFEYNILKNDTINVKEDSQNLTISFNKIDKKNDEIEIDYYIKIIDPENYIKTELMKTVSLTESKSSVYLVHEQAGELMSTKIKKIKYSCIQVIAYIKDGPINEYVAYNPVYLGVQPGSGSGTGSSGKSTSFYVIIGVSVALFVIIVVLIVVILFFNAKNKDLMDKVNKISFVNDDSKPKADSNLLMDDNELQ